MSDSLQTQLVSELSSKLPSELVEDLIGSYDKVLTQFRKAAWDETLSKAGKFVENVFRLLYFIVHSKVLDKRYIIRRRDKKYVMTGPGESYISQEISKIT
jgi:hypothetical protein